MAKVFFAIASILGALSVAGGAFGAHALKGQLTETAIGSFETGIRYQMYHTLALLVVALLVKQSPEVSSLTVAGWCFILGIALFSGSLYGLSLAGIKALGPVTPLGGVAFIVGWLCLAVGSTKAF